MGGLAEGELVSRDRYDPYFWREQDRDDAIRRKREAESKARAREKKDGRAWVPVRVAGRNIASTFWGKAWCLNLERYGDYQTRLPRGRSYLRSGAIKDLAIEPGVVRAVVVGTDVYDVEVKIRPLSKPIWKDLKRVCAGHVGSLVSLLEGKLSDDVMRAVTAPHTGLFPEPREITFRCTCPDWARMCKHIAAALYAVGARLDEQPDVLFALREVDPAELTSTEAVDWLTLREPTSATLDRSRLARVFGIDLVRDPEPRRTRYGRPKK